MIVVGTRTHGQGRRRPIPVMGVTFHKSEWMECGDDPKLSPTAFLVEQPPDYALAPHFHRENQFQLFVEGSGTIGRDALGAVTVHYAGAYTGYGPLLSPGALARTEEQTLIEPGADGMGARLTRLLVGAPGFWTL